MFSHANPSPVLPVPRPFVIASLAALLLLLPLPSAAAARFIRVRGTFVFDRVDENNPADPQTRLPADSLTVYIVDFDDEIFDQQDDILATTHTDAQGRFDVRFFYDADLGGGEENPDLYVWFVATNQAVTVMDGWGDMYDWVTDVHSDYAGSDLDIGTIVPASGDVRALNIHNTITRARRWLLENAGFQTPAVGVRFGDYGPLYLHWTADIHLPGGSASDDGGILHEYGHHWINMFGDYEEGLGVWGTSGAYVLNGFCDPSHCTWCEESSIVAWQEGFPDWFSDVIGREIEAQYGYSLLEPSDYETVSPCHVDSRFHDADRTEGILAAVLRDIEDSTQDDQDAADGVRDALQLGWDEIFTVASEDFPQTPTEFLLRLKARYYEHREALWESAKNDGYEIDLAPPENPRDLRSTSHQRGVPSPRARASLAWTRARDDASGPRGYRISMTKDAPAPPAPDSLEIADVTSYTTRALSPGLYYFNIQTVDRSGKSAVDHVSYGPIIIKAQAYWTPLDLPEGVVPSFVAPADSDGDGNLDLFVVTSNKKGWLLRGNGDGTFVPSGILTGTARAGAWGDVDNDGDPDLYIVGDGLANRLLQNNGDSTFTNITPLVLADSGPGVTASSADYDRDGLLDLYLVQTARPTASSTTMAGPPSPA